MKAEPLYVVITERDLPESEAYRNGGAIIFETYVRDASLFKALNSAKLNKQYGNVWIGRVEVLTLDEAREFYEGAMESLKEKPKGIG